MPLTGPEQADLYIQSLLDKHAQGVAAAAADAYLQSIADRHYLGIGYSDDAAASASVPAVPLTGPEQADLYIQSLLDKHAQGVARRRGRRGRRLSPVDRRPALPGHWLLG